MKILKIIFEDESGKPICGEGIEMQDSSLSKPGEEAILKHLIHQALKFLMDKRRITE